jgi:hypothetical protein
MIYPDIVPTVLHQVLDWALPHEEAAVRQVQEEIEEEKLVAIASEKEAYKKNSTA